MASYLEVFFTHEELFREAVVPYLDSKEGPVGAYGHVNALYLVFLSARRQNRASSADGDDEPPKRRARIAHDTDTLPLQRRVHRYWSEYCRRKPGARRPYLDNVYRDDESIFQFAYDAQRTKQVVAADRTLLEVRVDGTVHVYGANSKACNVACASLPLIDRAETDGGAAVLLHTREAPGDVYALVLHAAKLHRLLPMDAWTHGRYDVISISVHHDTKYAKIYILDYVVHNLFEILNHDLVRIQLIAPNVQWASRDASAIGVRIAADGIETVNEMENTRVLGSARMTLIPGQAEAVIVFDGESIAYASLPAYVFQQATAVYRNKNSVFVYEKHRKRITAFSRAGIVMFSIDDVDWCAVSALFMAYGTGDEVKIFCARTKSTAEKLLAYNIAVREDGDSYGLTVDGVCVRLGHKEIDIFARDVADMQQNERMVMMLGFDGSVTIVPNDEQPVFYRNANAMCIAPSYGGHAYFISSHDGSLHRCHIDDGDSDVAIDDECHVSVLGSESGTFRHLMDGQVYVDSDDLMLPRAVYQFVATRSAPAVVAMWTAGNSRIVFGAVNYHEFFPKTLSESFVSNAGAVEYIARISRGGLMAWFGASIITAVLETDDDDDAEVYSVDENGEYPELEDRIVFTAASNYRFGFVGNEEPRAFRTIQGKSMYIHLYNHDTREMHLVEDV